MPLWHRDLDKKKITGGRKTAYRSKRTFEAGGFPSETKIGDSLRTVERGRGGTVKQKIHSERYVVVTDQKTNSTQKTEILRVINNPVSADYDRRKIMTKGTLIATSLGEAIITSRPGQHGVINAILLNERG